MAAKGGNLFIKAIDSVASKITSGAKLTVGFYSGSTEDDGTPVATVAYINEFGEGVPARPFFRRMIAKESGQWGEKLARVLRKNDCNVKTGLGMMGEGIKGQLVQSIIDYNLCVALEKFSRHEFNSKLKSIILGSIS